MFTKIRVALLASTFALGLGVLHHARAESGYPDGPTTLAIFFKAKPENRPALRSYMINRELDRLAAWQHQGILKRYQILYNPYVDSHTWDATILVEFPSYCPSSKDLGLWVV